ncbi:MAG: rod shape-determining protein MreD [Muribaculum sp.]|nr:rod shape-determining protein MreD [Muribaculum sp.]
MTKTIVQFSILFVVLVLAQAIMFNNICLFNLAVPFFFIYFIIRLPITLSEGWVMTFSFLAGLIVDMFANTQGMNALACTLLAAARRPVLHLYFPREDELTIPEPSIKSLGLDVYVKYMFTMVAIYSTAIFVIEAFSFFDPIRLALRVLCSTLLTFLLLLGLDNVMSRSR